METDLNKRYQTLLILWFALLMSIGFYFLFSVFFTPEVGNAPRNPPSAIMILTMTALGAFLVILSFVVKNKLLQGSIERQDVGLVQKALVISCAMCEVAALLGLVEHFLVNNREYYLLFLIAAIGTALHFPKRNQLESASYKNPANLT